MMRSKFFVQMSLAAALALASPAFADKGGTSGPNKPEDSPAVDNRGGAATPAPAQPNNGMPDDKGANTKPDDKGVDPAGKADDKGANTKPDDKGVDPAGKPDDSRRFELSAAPAGDRIHAQGQVEIRVEREVEHGAERQKERLRIKLQAEVEDGAAFLVWVNGGPAGTVLARDGRGELELENEPGKVQPAGVFPVQQIKNVSVANNSGALVLSRDF